MFLAGLFFGFAIGVALAGWVISVRSISWRAELRRIRLWKIRKQMRIREWARTLVLRFLLWGMRVIQRKPLSVEDWRKEMFESSEVGGCYQLPDKRPDRPGYWSNWMSMLRS